MKSTLLLGNYQGVIEVGSTNAFAVKQIKDQLNKKGFGSFDITNPNFGPATLENVIDFQKANSLLPDGKVGDLTWKKLFNPLVLPNPKITTSVSLRALEIIKSQVYVRELTNNNDGKEVEEYLRAVGLPKGYSWCMALQFWAFDKAAKELSRKNPLFCTGGVLDQWNRQPKEFKFYQPEKGDIFIMDFGKGKGHCGIVDDSYMDRIHTFDGNTSADPSLPTQDRDGNGIFERSRKKSSINKGYLRFEI